MVRVRVRVVVVGVVVVRFRVRVVVVRLVVVRVRVRVMVTYFSLFAVEGLQLKKTPAWNDDTQGRPLRQQLTPKAPEQASISTKRVARKLRCLLCAAPLGALQLLPVPHSEGPSSVDQQGQEGL